VTADREASLPGVGDRFTVSYRRRSVAPSSSKRSREIPLTYFAIDFQRSSAARWSR